MEDDRTKIIIKEIQHWKNSRILPERYCDYLLALYTQGESLNENVIERKKQFQAVSLLAQITFLIIMVPLSYIVIYFTELQLIMQIVIMFIFLIFSFSRLIIFRKKHYELYPIAIMSTFSILILFSVFLSEIYSTNLFLVECIVIVEMISLIIFSYLEKQIYLKILGLLALLFTVSYMFL